MIIGFLIFLFWYLCLMFASGLITIAMRIQVPQDSHKITDCYCDYCGKPIKPKWLSHLPIINFLYLKGITKCCKLPILILHPIAEFGLGSTIFLVIVSIWGI